MSQEQPTTTLPKYYKRFWTRFRQDVREKAWEVVIAIAIIIVIVFCQFYFGLAKSEATLSNALLNIAPSLGVLFVYSLRHLIRTPWLLDVERQEEINESKGALKEVQASLDSLTSDLARPKFAITKVSADSYGEFDEDDRYRLTFAVENIGSHAADQLVWRVVTVDEDLADKEPTFADSSMTNEIPINQPFDMEFGFRAAFRAKPMIIVFALRYKDALTKRELRQVFFHKWVQGRLGIVTGPEMRHLTIEEREAAQERLKEQL